VSANTEFRRARAVRRDLVPSHQRTAATQDNRAIERSLMADLNTYVNLIRTELDKTPSMQWTQLRATIIPRLRDSVMQTMRGHIEQSYMLGAKYITSRVGLQGASFMTHADIDNVKSLTQEFTDKFFARIQLSLNNTINKTFATREPPDSTINPNFTTNSIAISATSKALAEGTRMKAKSILQTNQRAQAILSAAAIAAKKKKKKKQPVPVALPLLDDLTLEDELAIGTGLGLGFAGGISLASLAAQQLTEQEWIWICAENPCTICQELEGEVFSMDDIDFAPQPIDDTHNNCRCRLLLL
jgi:hypothetical protein